MPFEAMYSKQLRLINRLEAILIAGLVPATVNHVFVGYDNMPHLIPSRDFPYLTIDDGGESATNDAPFQMEKKAYLIKFELGVFANNTAPALRDLLGRWNTIMQLIWTERKMTDATGIIADDLRPVTVTSGIMFDKDDNPQFRVREAVVEYRTWQVKSEW